MLIQTEIKSIGFWKIEKLDSNYEGSDSQISIIYRKMCIRPQRKISAYKNISLLDRLEYCEPPLFGGEAMLQDAPIIITD